MGTLNQATKGVDSGQVVQGNWGGLLDAAMEVGVARREILRKMRAALNRNDVPAVLGFARELCGEAEPKANGRVQ